MARKGLSEGENRYTLGPLVHNDAVVKYLAAHGVKAIDSLDEIDRGTVVIRSHGVNPQVFEAACSRELQVIDATCPLVKNVQTLAERLGNEGYDIAVFGDVNHPEVVGILGWAGERTSVIANVAEARDLRRVSKLGILSQTTKGEEEFFAVVEELLPKAREVRVFNTICEATRKRQEAAIEVCGNVDIMVVIGDKKSSNTSTLARVCQGTGVRTVQVENSDDLKPEWFHPGERIGVTAGASTPDWIIKEVLDRMVEFEENVAHDETIEEVQENAAQDEAAEKVEEVETVEGTESPEEVEVPEEIQESSEQSFVEMEAELAESFTQSVERGSIIEGVVVQVNDDEVMVDVGGKSEGIIPLRELSVRDLESARDVVEVGDEIEVYVLRWDDDGTILLSKKRVDTQRTMDKLEEVFHQDGIVEGTVIKTVKGGLLVDIGVVAFLPASHVDIGFVRNLEEYVAQPIKAKIIEFNRNKRRGSQVVISRKQVLLEERAQMREEFWNTVEEGQVWTGKVKRLTDYGAFVDLGGFEGLLHISEMAHMRVNHPSDVMSEGDELVVYILAVDRERERVSLSRKKILKSPWETVDERYQEGEVITGTVVRIAPFGAFVEIEPGVDGLVHISELSRRRIDKVEDVVDIGEEVYVKILNINPEEKRIALSIKEVQDIMETEEVRQYLEDQDAETDETDVETEPVTEVEQTETELEAEETEPETDSDLAGEPQEPVSDLEAEPEVVEE